MLETGAPKEIRRNRALRPVLLGVVLTHLVLVSLGAAHVNLWDKGALGYVAGYYSAISGADSPYGFFAPDVVTVSPRAVFEVTRGSKVEKVELLDVEARREAVLKSQTLVEMFESPFVSDEMRHELAASWAAKIFSRFPDATRVRVRVEAYDLPSMKAYREGARPEWTLMAEESFDRPALMSSRGPS